MLPLTTYQCKENTLKHGKTLRQTCLNDTNGDKLIGLSHFELVTRSFKNINVCLKDRKLPNLQTGFIGIVKFTVIYLFLHIMLIKPCIT